MKGRETASRDHSAWKHEICGVVDASGNPMRREEQNRKQPDAPALAYLRVIAREPGVVGALSKKIAPIPTVEVDRVVRGENQLDGPANDRAVFIDLRKSIGMTDFVHPVCDLPRGKALAL
jgi:hypothetical protein